MDTAEARSKLLHKIYPQLQKGYEKLIDDYSVNKYLKLKKGVNLIKNSSSSLAQRISFQKATGIGGDIRFNNKEIYKTIIILIIMYLGKNSYFI
jgi:hypothetical protein